MKLLKLPNLAKGLIWSKTKARLSGGDGGVGGARKKRIPKQAEGIEVGFDLDLEMEIGKWKMEIGVGIGIAIGMPHRW